MLKNIFALMTISTLSFAGQVSITWGDNESLNEVYPQLSKVVKINKVPYATNVMNVTKGNDSPVFLSVEDAMVDIFGGCISQKDENVEWQCVDKFSISSVEVTNFMYNKFDPEHKNNTNNPNSPVVDINIEDAKNYISWLSKKTGIKYRLPTIDEWQYAALAGTNAGVIHSVCEYANLKSCNDLNSISAVGSYLANNWGLYDMYGNVWEMTNGADLSIVGGSWNSSIQLVNKNLQFNGKKSNDVGFRLAVSGI